MSVTQQAQDLLTKVAELEQEVTKLREELAFQKHEAEDNYEKAQFWAHNYIDMVQSFAEVVYNVPRGTLVEIMLNETEDNDQIDPYSSDSDPDPENSA